MAQGQSGARVVGLSVGTVEVMQAAVFAGVMGAALVSAVWLIRERARTAAENSELRARVSDLNASIQRSRRSLTFATSGSSYGRAKRRSPKWWARFPPRLVPLKNAPASWLLGDG